MRINGKRVNLGCFKIKEEAALAYNEAVAKLYGSNAVLNKIAVCEKHEVSHLDVEQNKKYARMV